MISSKSEFAFLNIIAALSILPELIPSTARSTSSIAAALPSHLLPLLQPALERAKTALLRVLPEVKVANVLEEAEFEEEEGGGQESDEQSDEDLGL